MTNYKIITSLAFIILSLSTTQISADNKWWNKGSDYLKELNNKKHTRGPSINEINNAFKEALSIGSKNVVNQLSAVDGFNTDPAIHIHLPKKLKSVKKALSKIGMKKHVDRLETKLNRAAEAATPKAKKLFMNAITKMTFKDVKKIYKGPDDSATRYFKEKMTPELRIEMRSIIETSLSDVGAIKAYDKAIKKYKKLPFVPDVKTDITNHVVNKSISGIFYYLAKEEAAIRKDPKKQTTNLLKKVFGSLI